MIGRKSLENLRARPRHERHAVATMAAYGAVGILFFIWALLFFRTVATIVSHPSLVDPASNAPRSAQ